MADDQAEYVGGLRRVAAAGGRTAAAHGGGRCPARRGRAEVLAAADLPANRND
ncbi:hypothetical protein ACFQ1L_21970 [Phytohabitans flavus]|uniref:hypothetical protein n=1 Tax=Phytohabitans flavus TaxID=1076124 RepID=UPI001565989E|nr:hypothetical protein [Phytohabitans flavus]